MAADGHRRRGLATSVALAVALGSGACFQPSGLAGVSRASGGVRAPPACTRLAAEAEGSGGAESLEALAARLRRGLGTFKDFDELEPEAKRARVSHYMDLTGCADRAVAEAELTRHGWDVERAAKDGRTYAQVGRARRMRWPCTCSVQANICRCIFSHACMDCPPHHHHRVRVPSGVRHAPHNLHGAPFIVATSLTGQGSYTMRMVFSTCSLPGVLHFPGMGNGQR